MGVKHLTGGCLCFQILLFCKCVPCLSVLVPVFEYLQSGVILSSPTVISENIWDPFSTTQTSRMVAIVQKLVDGYPSVVNAENKNTQVSCLFISIWDKLRNLSIVLIYYIGKHNMFNEEQGVVFFFNSLMLCYLVNRETSMLINRRRNSIKSP